MKRWVWPARELRAVAEDDLSTTRLVQRVLRLERQTDNVITTTRQNTPTSTLSHTASVNVAHNNRYINVLKRHCYNTNITSLDGKA